MTSRPIVGGVRFLCNEPIDGSDEHGFSDLDISVEWVPEGQSPAGHRVKAPSGLAVWFDPDEALIRLPVLHENTVVWSWQLRQVAPIVAAWHHRLTIHASAVSINGRVIAFVGESEAGKSTLAWELVKAEAVLVSDDLLPVRFDEVPHTAHHEKELPIAGICFLSREGDAPALTPLASAGAFERHLANGFGEHGDPDVWAYQFDVYHRLATEVDHYVLSVPDDRSGVPAVATWLISEFDHAGSTS